MLSIIMPVYNTKTFLEATVKCVLAQTYRDFELLLVDDGATDGSGALCDALAQTDCRIRVIHKANGGVASARNAGLDAARGDFIGWVDSDDLVSPVMFEVLMDLAKTYEADIVQCTHVREPAKLAKATPETVEILGAVDSLKRIYRSHYTNALALWSKIFRRELFHGLRFTEGAAYEDDEVVPMLLERGKKNVFVEIPLYCYIKREQSIITTPNARNIMALTRHLENRMLHFEKLDEELYELGKDHFFKYLKEAVACNQPAIRQQAGDMLKKHTREFRRNACKADRFALTLLHCGKWGRQLVEKTEFEPVQRLLARIKGR